MSFGYSLCPSNRWCLCKQNIDQCTGRRTSSGGSRARLRCMKIESRRCQKEIIEIRKTSKMKGEETRKSNSMKQQRERKQGVLLVKSNGISLFNMEHGYGGRFTSCPERVAAIDGQHTGRLIRVQKVYGKCSPKNQGSKVLQCHVHDLCHAEPTVHDQRHETLIGVVQQLQRNGGQLALGHIDNPRARLGGHQRKWTVGRAVEDAA